jgi:hypothetical protein
MHRVFVVQDSDKDISPAKRYGKLHVLLSTKEVLRGYDGAIARLEQRLEAERFSPDDFLLCVGDPVIIGFAIHYALKLTGGSLNVLKWDRVDQEYQVVRL